MKKIVKMITIVIIIVLLLIIYSYKLTIKETRKGVDTERVIDVQIIDRYNKMQELYENPEKEEYIAADIIIDGIYYENVGIRTKGDAIYAILEAFNYDNYSFKVKLDYTDKSQTYKGMNEIHLNTTFYDNTGIREYLVYEMYNRMGIKTQQYCFGHLKIGELDRGLITIVEVINEEYVQEKYDSKFGNLYKPRSSEVGVYSGSDLRYAGDEFENYQDILNNTKTFLTSNTDKKRLINIIKNINSTSQTEVIENNFMDFDKIIKMVAINKVLANVDVFTSHTLRNYFLYEENGKIDILTFDFDISMNTEINMLYWTDDMNEFDLFESDIQIYSRIIEIIIQNSEYNKKYYQYVEETKQMLKDMQIEEFIDELYNKTRSAIISNERKMYSINVYEQGIKNLKNFMIRRGNGDEVY